MPGMKVLLAGLVACGVAVLVVVLLKCLCFIGELLNAKREAMLLRANGDAFASSTPPPTVQQQLEPTPQHTVRRLTDRIYVILVTETQQQQQPGKEQDSPPSYEEAVQLLHHQSVSIPRQSS